MPELAEGERFYRLGANGVSMRFGFFALPLLFLTTASATSQTYSIVPERKRPVVLQRSPNAVRTDEHRLATALGALNPQRPGVVDAYVVVAALDSDAVFGREAREAARVLSRRYDAKGRTIVLTAGADGTPASPATLAAALARVGTLADAREDAVILYTTSHGGAPEGLVYRDVLRGAGAISPDRLAAMLDGARTPNRLVMVSACYSGIFVPRLASDTSVVISAAAADRSSFGCDPGNDWTFFGDALVNRALRKKQPVEGAFREARASIAGWEAAGRLEASRPQISVGKGARWLAALDARVPKAATSPVGRSPAAGATR